MSEKYTKKELRKYLSSALKLGAYGFGIGLEIYDAKLSNPEYKNYSWNPYMKDDELKILNMVKMLVCVNFQIKKK